MALPAASDCAGAATLAAGGASDEADATSAVSADDPATPERVSDWRSVGLMPAVSQRKGSILRMEPSSASEAWLAIMSSFGNKKNLL